MYPLSCVGTFLAEHFYNKICHQEEGNFEFTQKENKEIFFVWFPLAPQAAQAW